MLLGSLYLINTDNAQGKQVLIILSNWKAIFIRLTVVWLSVIKSTQAAESHLFFSTPLQIEYNWSHSGDMITLLE